MYDRYWGLRRMPFSGPADPDRFWNGPPYEEALARCGFLVEGHRQGGLLLGPSGCGKTLLLKVFVRRMRRSRRAAALVNLAGLDEHELLWQLSAQLGLAPEMATTRFELWRRLNDRIVENRLQQFDTILAFDDVDQTSPECLQAVGRLCQLDSTAPSRLTCLFALHSAEPRRRMATLTDLAELRIELEPLDQQETERYIVEQLEQAGRTEPIFETDALRCIYECSRGIPRRINRLCDFSLVAGAAAQVEVIPADVVESVYAELQVGPHSSAPALAGR